MTNRKQTISCQQARDLDIVDFLAKWGHHPQRITGVNYWYLSPLRTEKTASFKVNRAKNRWYDFGDGSKGNLIDLGTKLFRWTVKEFLEKIAGETVISLPSYLPPNHDNPIDITKVTTLQSHGLIRYLTNRKISLAVAAKYCCQVNYRLGEKSFSAIGFRNAKGGYELRNEQFKGSCSPKAITILSGSSSTVMLFEGFFDMLTMQTILSQSTEKMLTKAADMVVLNSIAFFEKALPQLERYKRVLLFFDNDAAGRSCTEKALSALSAAEDKSSLYAGYKDLNEWACHIGKHQRTIRQILLNGNATTTRKTKI